MSAKLLPAPLRERLLKDYPKEQVEKIAEGFCAKRVTSFRANTLLLSARELSSALKEAKIPHFSLSFYPDAFYADRSEYKNICSLPMYERGEIYFQSLSSLLPPLALDPHEGERILDMCAAPGGKTTQLSALSKGLALITACEKDKTRFLRLRHNVERQRAKNVTLLAQDALTLSEYFRFDKILLDAPCSGSGTILLNGEEKKGVFDEKLLSFTVKAQRELLKKAFSLLKKGGEMVYSTCSVLKEENEEQIFFLKKSFDFELLPLPPFDAETLSLSRGMLTVCPSELFEGFFLARIKKL